MNVQISKNAELFFKALEDIWVAEQSWFGSPNNAVWSCTQAVEKTMKGFLRCLNREFDYGHELKEILFALDTLIDLSVNTVDYINYLNRFSVGLRYKNMANDPSPEDARIAISRAKHIMQEFSGNPKISQFMDEAREVHAKVLKLCYEKYSDVDISADKSEE